MSSEGILFLILQFIIEQNYESCMFLLIVERDSMANHRQNDEIEESDEDNCPSDDDGEDDEWNEMEQDQEPTKCLFCENLSESIDAAVKHLNQAHHIDLGVLKSKFNMDQYLYIKVS